MQISPLLVVGAMQMLCTDALRMTVAKQECQLTTSSRDFAAVAADMVVQAQTPARASDGSMVTDRDKLIRGCVACIASRHRQDSHCVFGQGHRQNRHETRSLGVSFQTGESVRPPSEFSQACTARNAPHSDCCGCCPVRHKVFEFLLRRRLHLELAIVTYQH